MSRAGEGGVVVRDVGDRQARPAGLGVEGSRLRHPARIAVAGFAVAAAVGTVLLSLPVAAVSGERTDVVDAAFTATSAVCLTGLITVETGSHWSTFGEVVVLLLIQAGGLGIMTLAALFAVLVSGRLRLRAQLVARTETKNPGMGDLRRMVPNIIRFSLVCEAVVAAVLTVVFLVRYDRPPGDALYDGVFHAVSAFNNAGFSTHPDSLMSYVGDPWVCLPIAAAAIVGGLGFPVVFELVRSWRRPRGWSVLTRVTVVFTALLLVSGTLVITMAEYTNPETLGRLDGEDKWLAGFFASVTARSVGFNTIDTSAMGSESLLATDVLMFIGGGSAGTAGGIKVTTFGLLAFVIWAEMRGDPGIRVGKRRVPEGNQRQALAIVLLSVGAVAASTFAVLGMTAFTLDQVLFEVISAFATVGLSTGITGELPPAAKVLLTVLMFAGRLGPLTLATALALRERARRYDLPEERIIVG
ncbi:TrkH family potassium uptake protein [Streptomyces megasporus]|uniref:TrkH family potassium uptake protein n=1 Tax=Streptomyces megasporus TaxID=44060 RepID=UPI000998316C|nr:potassium transporter TrkG [Streptomyces megasporus]